MFDWYDFWFILHYGQCVGQPGTCLRIDIGTLIKH